MIPDFSGDFLNYESTEDGDVIEILTEGKVERNDILKKDLFNIKVKKGGKEMTYSPSMKAGRILQSAFGKDSKSWIGKKFQIIHADKRMIIRPIKEEKVA